MKRNFLTYLTENKSSFFNLYYTEFPSKEVKAMKDGKKRDEAEKVEEIKYKKLMTDFLQNVGAMNN